MKKIPLTQGKYAIVDDEDYDRVSRHRWFAMKLRNTWYAFRSVQRNYKRFTLLMHREVLGLKYADKLHVDHKNHNGLDMCKCNLRPCNHKQNQQNRISHNGKSKYKGVSCNPRLRKKWYAQIQGPNKRIYLGAYFTEEEAALAYDKKALELFGEFAFTNF